MIIGGQLPDNSIVTADADPMSGPLTYSVEAKPLPVGADAANGGFVGQLKRQLEPFGSQALEDDNDDDYMEA